MANELTEKQQGLVSLVKDTELGNIIKPLVKEIHLFDSYIAGTTHLEDKSVLEALAVGDMLSLQREDNKFDTNAILVLNGDGKKLGYVPEKDNIIFAPSVLSPIRLPLWRGALTSTPRIRPAALYGTATRSTCR